MNRENIREEVLDLMKAKDAIEQEIKELTSILTKNGVGMSEPLVDAEGFPINTIDIYQVRNARHRIICLQNDHKNLMKQIENGLYGYYNTCPAEAQRQDSPMDTDEGVFTTNKIPFAKVTLVSEDSPAENAGIQVDDEIIEFGSVNKENFKNITDIATVVQNSEGTRVNVKLKRGETFITKMLIPRKWTGKGLLGCNIVTINT